MTDAKKYTVTQQEREESLARMLGGQRSVQIGLTAGQKRALRQACAAGQPPAERKETPPG